MRKGIKVPQRGQFVAEEFQADGKAAGQGPHVHNAAAQGKVAFLRHLRFGFIALRLQPFDQIQRVGLIALLQAAGAALQFRGRQRLFQQRGNAGHDQPGLGNRIGGQRHQRFQPVADHINMRQTRLVGRHLPGRVEECRRGCRGGGELSQPGLEVLREDLLCFQVLGDDDDGAPGEQEPEQRGHERVGGGTHRVQRQRYPLLHAFAQGLHGGS